MTLWLTESTWLLADWSLRWSVLIAAAFLGFAIRPPRTAAMRMLALQLVLLAGLLLPCCPRFWGPTRSPASIVETVPAPAMPPLVRPAEKASGARPSARTPVASSGSPEVDEPAALASHPTSEIAPSWSAIDWIGLIWLGGIAVALVRLFGGWLMIVRLRCKAQWIDDAQSLEQLGRCRRRMQIRREVALITTESAVAPVLIGGRWPRIVVPAGWNTFAADSKEAILLHELAHLRRRDDLCKPLEEIVRACFWPHPLVHWLLNRIGSEREELCDAAVLDQGVSPHALATALLEFCRRHHDRRRSMASSAMVLPFVRQRSLKDRIQSLMEEEAMRSTYAGPSRLFALGLSSFTLACAAIVGGFGVAADKPAPDANTNSPAASARNVPTPQEIIAAYRANFARMLPIAIEYRVSQLSGAGDIETDRERLESLETILKMPLDTLQIDHRKPTPEELAGFETYVATLAPADLEMLKRQLDAKVVQQRLTEPIVERGFLWTDGRNFHGRWPHDGKNSGQRFIAAVGPPENLAKSFNDVRLASWVGGRTPHLRCWFGGNQGRVAQQLSDCSNVATLPPIGLVHSEWTTSTDFHDLDLFLSHEESEYRIVGPADLDGRKTLIVDGFFSAVGTNGLRERVRGWIDAVRGHLPVRLEWSIVDAQGQPGPSAGVFRTVETLAVREIVGGFYPATIRRQEFRYDFRANAKYRADKQAGKLPADASPPPRLPGMMKTWEVTMVEPAKPIEAAALALVFPKGALYTNAIDGKMYHEGNSTPVAEDPPYLRKGFEAKPLKVAAWLDNRAANLADLRGKVIFLQFLDGSRPESKEIIALIKALEEKYQQQEVAFITIYAPGAQLNKLVEKPSARRSQTFVGIDQGKSPAQGETSQAYVAGGGYMIIDRQGKVAFNPLELEEPQTLLRLYSAAKKLSIPWPLDEGPTPSEEDSLRVYREIMHEEIDAALKRK